MRGEQDGREEEKEKGPRERQRQGIYSGGIVSFSKSRSEGDVRNSKGSKMTQVLNDPFLIFGSICKVGENFTVSSSCGV